MPVSMYWEDEAQTIMRYDISGRWTWPEFYDALNKVLPEWEKITHRTDTIIKLESIALPTDTLRNVRTLSEKQNTSSGLSVIVTTNTLAHVLYNTSRNLYPKVAQYFRMAHTMEEARALIQTARAQIRSTD
jgi:hypothetical protein